VKEMIGRGYEFKNKNPQNLAGMWQRHKKTTYILV
jgi:hypothetical protein